LQDDQWFAVSGEFSDKVELVAGPGDADAVVAFGLDGVVDAGSDDDDVGLVRGIERK